MDNLWKDEEAARFPGPLGPRVYSSRLLGRERALVLHGGGNTSVKLPGRDLLGDEEIILHVKGSGIDLERIDESGFSPVRLARLLRLARLPAPTDDEIVNELRISMTRAAAPTPSVELLLHAVLPHAYVDHTHADALLTINNTEGGEARLREIYGDEVVLVPYVRSGFGLAQLAAQRWAAEGGPRTAGMVLLRHGLFTFGATARESYDRMISLVTRAEKYLARQGAWSLPPATARADGQPRRAELAALRQAVSRAAGAPMVLSVHDDPRCLSFARRPDLARITQQGPTTPDHVIRTKRVPMLGRDVEGFAAAYRRYCEEHAPEQRAARPAADLAPRVILDPDLGLVTAGRLPREAALVRDIYVQSMDVLERAELLGGWQGLPAKDIFEIEHWDLERAKLGAATPLPFAGEVALVTGAASGIGKACVASLLARGAAVVGLDLDPAVERMHARPDFLGVAGDVAGPEVLPRALEAAARAFGGLDMLVLNAGVFPSSKRIEALGDEEWRRVLRINLDANLALMREAHPLLKAAPRGGRVAIIGSKNVPAPGPGAASYSASKAALTQLGRVAALEWGADGIRVNMLHPDAVFDTGLWTPEVLAQRARNYGITVEQYKTKNVLRTEVRSADVAELAAELCGPLFAKTTGAQIPIDGGNDRVI